MIRGLHAVESMQDIIGVEILCNPCAPVPPPILATSRILRCMDFIQQAKGRNHEQGINSTWLVRQVDVYVVTL